MPTRCRTAPANDGDTVPSSSPSTSTASLGSPRCAHRRRRSSFRWFRPKNSCDYQESGVGETGPRNRATSSAYDNNVQPGSDFGERSYGEREGGKWTIESSFLSERQYIHQIFVKWWSIWAPLPLSWMKSGPSLTERWIFKDHGALHMSSRRQTAPELISKMQCATTY